MPSPYSYEFRKKALEAYQRGERKIQICRRLAISRNPLDLWIERYAETGDFQPISNPQPGRQPKIQAWDKFREFAREHGRETQKEMARLWGENVSQQNISDALRKLDITRKKKLTGIESEMNNNDKFSSNNSSNSIPET